MITGNATCITFLTFFVKISLSVENVEGATISKVLLLFLALELPVFCHQEKYVSTPFCVESQSFSMQCFTHVCLIMTAKELFCVGIQERSYDVPVKKSLPPCEENRASRHDLVRIVRARHRANQAPMPSSDPRHNQSIQCIVIRCVRESFRSQHSIYSRKLSLLAPPAAFLAANMWFMLFARPVVPTFVPWGISTSQHQ